jgi:RNA polymerase sigma factor for flagellar operon FliA
MTTTAVQTAPSKDLIARDERILNHLSLVTAIASRVHGSLPVHVELDDLIHAGVMGLFDAATKFVSEKQVTFSAYAKHRIKGAILDSLRDLDWASRDMRRRQKQAEQVKGELTAKLHRDPTEAEMAQGMGVTTSRWRQMIVDLGNLGIAATQVRKRERDDQSFAEPPCATEFHPDRVYARSEIRARLGVAMTALPRRHQDVITLYYDRDMTMKEIGNFLGVNESRVSQIHKSALSRMQTALTTSGIQSSAAY